MGNEQRPWRTIARGGAGPISIAAVAAVGVALAVFAGLSSDDPPSAAAPGGVVDEDLVAELERSIGELAIPATEPLQLDPVEGPAIELDGPSVELRVLVLSTGDEVADLVTNLLDVIGVPFQEIDVGTTELTADVLRTEQRGHFNGIILADAEMRLPDGAPGLSRREWGVLHEYEREFSIREAILTGFPGTDPDGAYDYGFQAQRVVEGLDARWTGDAAGEWFPSVNHLGEVAITGPVAVGEIRDDGTGPAVMPLLIDGQDPAAVIFSRLEYADGREVLLSSLPIDDYPTVAAAVLYDFVDFATRGLHVGAARVHLAAHIDDLFIASPPWDAELNQPRPELAVRVDADDLLATVAMQQQLNAEHPLLGDFVVEFAFNGQGASLPDQGDADDGDVDTGDELTDAVVANRDALRFINHTYTHRDMDISAGTTAEQSRAEVLYNRVVWQRLGLPEAEQNAGVVVTGEHSGVYDDPRDDPASLVPYPDGLNTAMAGAFEAAGVHAIAGDASQANQADDQQVVGQEMLLLPRYPTGLLYNSSNPDELTDQYNYVFHERFMAAGGDPCAIAAASCSPLDYQQLLAREATFTVRHMLSYRRWPHYFHILNVMDYDDEGSTLLGDWLEAVMTEYERYSALPVDNVPFWQIERETRADLEARAAGPVAVLDLTAGEVVVTAGRDVELAITGIDGGEPYGGVVQSRVAVGTEPTRFAVAAG